MVREDILGGLRNALERGATLEQAIASFVNAGYPEKDVREAVQAISQMSIPKQEPVANVPKAKKSFLSFMDKKAVQTQLPAPPKPIPAQPLPQTMVQPLPQVQPQRPLPQTQQRSVQKMKLSPLLLILVTVLVVLLVLLAFSILFREQIAAFLKQLIG